MLERSGDVDGFELDQVDGGGGVGGDLVDVDELHVVAIGQCTNRETTDAAESVDADARGEVLARHVTTLRTSRDRPQRPGRWVDVAFIFAAPVTWRVDTFHRRTKFLRSDIEEG